MKKRILCFGDSNTWGAIPNKQGRYDENTRWTGVLQNLLGDRAAVVEEGLNGRTTVWDDPIEDKKSGLSYLPTCLQSQYPLDLVILMLGTNDCKERFAASPESIAQGNQHLIHIIQSGLYCMPVPKVLLVSPIWMNETVTMHPGVDIFGKDAVQKSQGLSEKFKAVAQLCGCCFFDAATAAQSSHIDGVHMDPANHQALGKAIYEEVCKIL